MRFRIVPPAYTLSDQHPIRWLIKLLLLTLLLSLYTPVSAQQSNKPHAIPLVFGVYAHIRSTEMIQKMVPLQRYLERVMAEQGFAADIQIRIYPSYAEAIDALVEGEVDFVRYGPVSYVIAKSRNPNIRLVAMESNSGSKLFNGVLAVPQDSPVRQLPDLKGTRIAFGDRQSTTGRYLSQAVLIKAGLKSSHFPTVSYLKRHDKVAFAEASGQYDAGAMN
ncbi:MAG: PhnD/SsuA/transferrin family substrate-binding protein, partial [Sedimenticola sp.]|nr:PhnD/SsuA/transferrin family substrate-binding protein [Sedimenticola sp.]